MTTVKASPSLLHNLAEAVGVARQWQDVGGRRLDVADDTLAAILLALGHETSSNRQIKESVAEIAAEQRRLPPMLVTEVGLATPIGTQAAGAELTGEDGVTRRFSIDGRMLAPINEPGYYDLSFDGRTLKIAVAPGKCPYPNSQGQRMWGTAVQISGLRGATPRDFGGFGELATTAELLGQAGCDALEINPVHALFPGFGSDYSPYSPSSRTFLNTALGDPALLGLPALPEGKDNALIDWPTALPKRLLELRQIYADLDTNCLMRIRQVNEAQGPALRRHAVFDALDCHFRPKGANGWPDWPSAFHDPDAPAVKEFAWEYRDEIDFHLFAQWLAREGLDAAQIKAREAGMAVGLITDLAVGVHAGGSDTWALSDTMLQGLTIGAPPDPLGPLGQNWSITSFSPAGLRNSGYRPWIEMLRSALRSAGGLRIDHAFGLARLWVIPEGGSSSQGSYLEYPFLDLARLIALEAHRAAAIIIAENLGTSPADFTEAISARNMLGMSVLWFERALDGGFIGAKDYPSNSVAMTGTHDTPTIAGWWTGRDLEWAGRLGRLTDGVDHVEAEKIRDWDRGLLWSTIGDSDLRPAPDDPQPVVEAALKHVAKSPAVLAIAPIEDLLGELEQPNLPGTTSEHPNWRRRLKAPTQILLNNATMASHLSAISNRN